MLSFDWTMPILNRVLKRYPYNHIFKYEIDLCKHVASRAVTSKSLQRTMDDRCPSHGHPTIALVILTQVSLAKNSPKFFF